MSLVLRPARADERSQLSALCLRSKAHWGYDAAFMAACVDELTLSQAEFDRDPIVVGEDARGLAGMAQISQDETGCFLDKMFIEPDRIGQGYGQKLFEWATQTARKLGAAEMMIDADPSAAGFYERMGCQPAGEVPSGSVAGRMLPRLVFSL